MTKGLREVECKHRGERESGANSAFDEKRFADVLPTRVGHSRLYLPKMLLFT